MNAILDIIMLAVLGLCILWGYRKGFVMAVAGVLTLLIALLVGSYVADNHSEQIGGYLEPYIGWISLDPANEALKDAGTGVQNDEQRLLDAVTDCFERLGMSSDAAENMARKVSALITQENLSIRSGISKIFTQSITYIVVFALVFLVTVLILTVVANIVNAAFKIPVLNALNKFGGIALGALYGFLILYAVTWVLRFTGVLISQETLEKTWFVRLFMNLNLFKAFLKY